MDLKFGTRAPPLPDGMGAQQVMNLIEAQEEKKEPQSKLETGKEEEEEEGAAAIRTFEAELSRLHYLRQIRLRRNQTTTGQERQQEEKEQEQDASTTQVQSKAGGGQMDGGTMIRCV